MLDTTGPARYFFLRRAHGAKEDLPNWPPEIKPLQQPDNWVVVAIYLTAAEDGWQAVPAREEAELTGDAGGAFVLTRATALGLSPEGHRSSVILELLGARIMRADAQGPEYATHLVVRVVSGMGLGAPKYPIVVPVEALVISGYLEHGDQAEAQLDLRYTPGELATMTPYLPDPAIERAANQTLDRVILSPRQRHEIKPEVEAGRVTLYGRAELTTSGELARDELERTAGVVEVVDRLIYGELLMDQVREALEAKGYGAVGVRYEHGLIELDGTVPDMAAVHKMREIALKVTGVRGVVVNQLNVLAPILGDSETADEVQGDHVGEAPPERGAGANGNKASQAGQNAATSKRG